MSYLEHLDKSIEILWETYSTTRHKWLAALCLNKIREAQGELIRVTREEYAAA